MQTLLNLLASVALLVWGTHIVRTGILRVFGANLRRFLSKSVSNRFSAFLAGLGVTGIVQSSSATALIASSFVSQNLIGLSAALAIMLGADVAPSWRWCSARPALDLADPPLLRRGLLLSLKTTRGQLGRVAIGLGLICWRSARDPGDRSITHAQGMKVIRLAWRPAHRHPDRRVPHPSLVVKPRRGAAAAAFAKRLRARGHDAGAQRQYRQRVSRCSSR